MNLYVDASAMVKRYVIEEGSDETDRWWQQATVVASTELCFVEVHAALAKAVRLGLVEVEIARRQADLWTLEWLDVIRIPPTRSHLQVASDLAWRRSLRGYDAVHLASAMGWLGALGAPVTLATFDRQLWDAAVAEGVAVLPEERP